MLVIFMFSAQPGDVSQEISGGLSHLCMQVLNDLFGLGWSDLKELQLAEIWDYPIRKLAHMTEFGILAMLFYWALGSYNVRISGLKKRYLYAWLLAIVYAASDEFHQLFVPNRDGNLLDVAVDGIGAMIALLFVFFFMCLVRKKGATNKGK